MNKKAYLNSIKEVLIFNNIVENDINLTLEDYEELYDNALMAGYTHEQAVERLGSPDDIYKALKGDLTKNTNPYNKLVALSPFVSSIIFFALGFTFDLWYVAWLAYLLVPITAIVVNTKGYDKYIALSPFIATIIYVILGFAYSIWHPAWLIYFIVPISGVIFKTKGKEKFLDLLFFVIAISFIVVILIVPSIWKYALLSFLIIPLLGYLLYYKDRKNLIGAALIVLAGIGYLALNIAGIPFKYTLLIFILPLIFAFINNDIKIIFKFRDDTDKYLFFTYLLIALFYLGFSLIFPYWRITWLILLAIPIIGIYQTTKFKVMVSYMPFIATIIFVALGYFFELWHIAWIAYLLIPMVAIIENHESDVKKDEQ